MDNINLVKTFGLTYAKAFTKAYQLTLLLLVSVNVHAVTALSNNPLFSGSSVPGNVLITPSVEFPTPTGNAYANTTYASATDYLGYFDKNKCYSYVSQFMTGLLFNTGVDNGNVSQASGYADTHWVLTANPSGASTGGSSLISTNAVATLSDSALIGNTANQPAGGYAYTTTFSMPTTAIANKIIATFNLKLATSDDRLTGITVNGSALTGLPTTVDLSTTASLITIPAGKFTAGTNTVVITVNNVTASTKVGFQVLDMKVWNIDTFADGSYFTPVATTTTKECSGYWSGNYLNWALTLTMDPFRSALSGGYRAVDRPGFTVLEKAWGPLSSGSNGNDMNITGNGALINKVTPYPTTLTNAFLHSRQLGNKFYFGNSSAPTAVQLMPENSLPATASLISTARTYIFAARVRVCVPGLLESNCKLYPDGNYKPTGLIQKNAAKLNFGTLGFLNTDERRRDGGVLTARMGAVGVKKTEPGRVDEINPNAEWDATTGVLFTNPRTAEATEGGGATDGVVNSGVINYLNKFGGVRGAYATFDHSSELYYAALRYFTKKGNVPTYSNMTVEGTGAAYSAAQIINAKDGFPVITDWYAGGHDPIKYSCATNYIIGIGDTNTHADGNVPGTSIRNNNNEPTLPTEVSNDYANLTVSANLTDNKFDAKTSTNYISYMQGLTATADLLGNRELPWCCGDGASFYMAGLAYDAHVRDMRTDLTGKQTITTYWLDVLESGANSDHVNDGQVGMANQFYLAAKYGGFKVPTGYVPYVSNYQPAALTADSWRADPASTTNLDPANYYRANNPKAMIDGLNAAFASIVANVVASSNAFSVVSPLVNSGNIAFSTSYTSDGWTGNVIGSSVSFNAAGDPVTTKVWDARDKVENQNWDTQRFIATYKCVSGTCSGAPFRLASLSTAQATTLGVAADQQKILNFLRGDRSNESPAGSLRKRVDVMGDIANSKVIAVGKPAAAFSDAYNAGYSSFKTAKANRFNMAYVGANDGMLHAIKGTLPSVTVGTTTTLDADAGKELFAYIPSALFNGPSTPATPSDDGLAALAKINNDFVHHHYVDSTPVVQDVDFNSCGSLAAAACTPNWGSLLVGGLGKGGKAYYAINVADPSTLSNEANLAAAVKWEFTDSALGFTYGKPVIAKIAASWTEASVAKTYNGWAVIVTSGYNNSDGNGYFFVLNAATGALIKKIPTYSSAPSSDAGLAHLNAYVSDITDFKADAAYAADLLGGLWRLNLSNFTVENIATLKDSAGVAQAVTTPPLVEVDQATGKRYVFVATGKLLDDVADSGNTLNHTFYAINDGTSGFGAFYNSSTLPSGVAFPILRAKLNDNSTLFNTTGVVVPALNSVGWYLDIADNYRVNVDMVVNAGIVAFVANKPSGSVCSDTSTSNGASRLYALSYGRGESAVTTASGYAETSTLARHIVFYKDVTGGSNNVKPKIAVTDENGNFTPSTNLKDVTSLGFKLLNWRDLPTAD